MMNWSELETFFMLCESLGVKPPEAAIRGREILDVAYNHRFPDTTPILGLTDGAIRDRVEAASIRAHAGINGVTDGLNAGLDELTRQLAREVREASLPDLDRIIEDLQPEFMRRSLPIAEGAQRFGFTLATTSDEVMLRRDPEAADVWISIREAWATVEPIASFRILMSKTFDVAPKLNPRVPALTPLDYSVCFAGDSWSEDGSTYIEQDPLGDIDWLALAATGLRLNTPSEVAEKTAQRAKRLIGA